MLIELKNGLVRPGRPDASIGEQIDEPDDEARELIEQGIAVEVAGREAAE